MTGPHMTGPHVTGPNVIGPVDLAQLRVAQARVMALETQSTPLEYLAAAQSAVETGDAMLAELIAASHSARVLKTANAVSDLCLETEVKFARLYSRPGTRRRRLLVGFTGSARRMMMPLPVFMQGLPPDADLLILFDIANRHYRHGIWDGHTALAGLARAAAPVTRSYADVIALGTSAGGFPAVRFAKLAGLRRGLSFGGRAIDDTLRILRGQPTASAYDPLCACDVRAGTEAIFSFSALHPEDSMAALRANWCANAHLVPLAGRRDHSTLWLIAGMGRLNDLLSLAFTAQPDELSSQLLAWNLEDLAKPGPPV